MPGTAADTGTIAAIASAPGCSARAIVRLSGPESFRVLGRLGAACAPTRAVRPVALAFDAIECPALLLTYPAPASYTGEDSAEIVVAGSPFLTQRLLGALVSTGVVRAALPGEFTARAYLNGKLSLDQAEGVAGLIGARTMEEFEAARRLHSGETGRRYEHWGDELVSLLALVEAGIDFTDQESVVPIDRTTLRERCERLGREIGTFLGAGAGREADTRAPMVVLWGRPNAGKSTLFNALLRRRRAVASQTPGTTRDVLVEPLDLEGQTPGAGRVMLADVAGLEGGGTSWEGAQSCAREAASRADLVLWCDPAGRFEACDAPPASNVLRVRTFADMPAAGIGREDLALCALDRWHLPDLCRLIAERVLEPVGQGVGTLLPRHRLELSLLREVVREVGAREPGGAGALIAPELDAELLRRAVGHMGRLTGRIDTEEILAKVFSTFCVGK